jgi:hypothetical protein
MSILLRMVAAIAKQVAPGAEVDSLVKEIEDVDELWHRHEEPIEIVEEEGREERSFPILNSFRAVAGSVLVTQALHRAGRGPVISNG